MSENSKLTMQNLALWQQRFARARIKFLNFDCWNTLAFSSAKVHPRLRRRLGLNQPAVLDLVCREPVHLAWGIVEGLGDQPVQLDSPLPDRFLQHCMETDPALQFLRLELVPGQILPDPLMEAITAEFLKSTAAKFVDLEPTAEDFRDLAEVIRSETRWTALFPDAEQFLVASHGRWEMNIVSNMWYASGQIFAREVNSVPLKHYFTHIITSFKVQARKPKPQIFLRAEELTDVPLRQHLMVGDSIPNDVLAALAAGHEYAVLVHRDDELAEEAILNLPDNVLVIESLMELVKVLPERQP